MTIIDPMNWGEAQEKKVKKKKKIICNSAIQLFTDSLVYCLSVFSMHKG